MVLFFLCFNIDTIREKIEFYNLIGLDNMLTAHPNQLIQSIDLSYARNMFYKSIGTDIDKSNYLLLFCNDRDFKKKYGFGKDKLKLMFNYDDYLKDMDNVVNNVLVKE